MLMPAIEAYGVSKKFPKSTSWLGAKKKFTVALETVTLKINPGEMFALLGPNGAGKTTLIKILNGLLLPDTGSAKINGLDVVQNGPQIRSQIGLLMNEERSFYSRLTGRQNLQFFSSLYGLNAQETRRKIEASAALFKIIDLEKPYQEYSSGTKCRLALARTFLTDAKVIFFDEPTKSLDPEAALELRLMMKAYCRNMKKTLFFTTHNTQEAEQLADRVAILMNGRIRAMGTMQELQIAAGAENSLQDIYLQWAVSADTKDGHE